MLFLFVESSAQGVFRFDSSAEKQTISFKLLSNLIVFPMEVNGRELNFILDSGVGSTLLFNLKANDSIELKNTQKIKLKGLGSEAPVDAILSKGNNFRFKNIVGVNQKLYVVFDDGFDLSSKLGITVHGIIGYEILKDFVVNINYGTKRISFYRPAKYNYKNCKKCDSFDLEFYKLKPYINVQARLEHNKTIPVKLLIDSGGSDAMWLFEKSHPDLVLPEKYFEDFLGEGLSGSIYGKRAFINALVLGKFVLEEPTVSFPDSVSISFARRFKSRNGSLGANILRRFNVTFDYRRSKIYLKRSSAFKKPFRYNMSGIDLAYNGKILVKEKNEGSYTLPSKFNDQSNRVNLVFNYKYTFKPSYIIHKIRPNSPAFEAGLLPGDIVIKINNKFTHELKLEEIVDKFYEKENKKITLVVERKGIDYEYHFYLKNMLK